MMYQVLRTRAYRAAVPHYYLSVDRQLALRAKVVRPGFRFEVWIRGRQSEVERVELEERYWLAKTNLMG
jgi:hypothetical protein